MLYIEGEMSWVCHSDSRKQILSKYGCMLTVAEVSAGIQVFIVLFFLIF